MACKVCLDLNWGLYGKKDPMHKLLRMERIPLWGVVSAKKRGCQTCFAIYRSIELFCGLDLGKDRLEDRMDESQTLSAVYVYLRPPPHPLELMVYVIWKPPMEMSVFSHLALEIFGDECPFSCIPLLDL